MYTQLRLLMPETNCNLSCKYCAAGYCDAAKKESTLDFNEEKVLSTIGDKQFRAISIWGGEPFANMEKLQRTVNFCKAHFPDKPTSILSNGYLLNDQIVSFLNRNDLALAISHDGVGQHYRGADFLKSEQYIERLKRVNNFIGFHSVIHNFNCDIPAIVEYFDNVKERLNREFIWAFGNFKIYDHRFLEFVPHGDSLEKLAYSFRWVLQRFAKQPGYISLERQLSGIAKLLDSNKSRIVSCGADNRLTVRMDGSQAYCQVRGELGMLDNPDLSTPMMCRSCTYVGLCAGICPSMNDAYRKKVCATYKIWYREAIAFLNSLRRDSNENQ